MLSYMLLAAMLVNGLQQRMPAMQSDTQLIGFD